MLTVAVFVPGVVEMLQLSALAVKSTHVKRLGFYWQRPSHLVGDRDMIDLDLQSLGLVNFNCLPPQARHLRLEVTQKGIDLLVSIRAERIANTLPHHDLGNRLAQWVAGDQGRLVWTNAEFKADALIDGTQTVQFVRPDVFSILPTHNAEKTCPVIHEVKISRADFLADVARPQKRSAYLALAGTVYYVVPEGLISIDEVPRECGLIVEQKSGQFKKIRSVRARRTQPSSWNLLNMVLKQPSMRPAPF